MARPQVTRPEQTEQINVIGKQAPGLGGIIGVMSTSG
jgi:hypothetical protein